MDQSYYHLRWGIPSLSRVRMKCCTSTRPVGTHEETEANEDGWSRGSERRGFKMFKAFGLVVTAHRRSQTTCWFYTSHEAPCGVCCSSPNSDRILLENMFSLSLKRHLSSLFPLFSHFSLIYSETSLFPFSATHSPFILILFLSISLCDTWPGVSMRGIL